MVNLTNFVLVISLQVNNYAAAKVILYLDHVAGHCSLFSLNEALCKAFVGEGGNICRHQFILNTVF